MQFIAIQTGKNQGELDSVVETWRRFCLSTEGLFVFWQAECLRLPSQSELRKSLGWEEKGLQVSTSKLLLIQNFLGVFASGKSATAYLDRSRALEADTYCSLFKDASGYLYDRIQSLSVSLSDAIHTRRSTVEGVDGKCILRLKFATFALSLYKQRRHCISKMKTILSFC